MTSIQLMVRDLALECIADLRVAKIPKSGRLSYARGYFMVAASQRPQIKDHKDTFLRIVEGK